MQNQHRSPRKPLQTNHHVNRTRMRVRRRKRRRAILTSVGLLLLLIVFVGSYGNNTTDKKENSYSDKFAQSELQSTLEPLTSYPTSQSTQIPTQTPTQSITQTPTEYITKSPTPQPTVFVTQAPTAIDITIQKISPGDSGEAVKKLQQRLKTLGFLSDSADGIYGTKTTAAVKAYQKAAGLEVTGICDYTTYLSMTSSDAPRIKKTETSSSNKEKAYSYIGNSATKKFHRSSCSEIKKMNDSNKVGISSREKAINNGYVPCKKCKP